MGRTAIRSDAVSAGRGIVWGAFMRMAVVRVLILVVAGLLAGCSTTPKLGDTSSATGGAQSSDTASLDSQSPDTTGSIAVQPAEPGRFDPPPPTLSTPGLVGDDPNDDVSLGKKYFRSNDYGLAEKSFRSAVEKHPRDAEAWVGLAASYDRLRRFDLADRAYAEAFRLIGPTVELLNDEGFSYMLRGDYARARKTLQQAAAKDPTNRYVLANLQLLDDSIRQHKAVQ